jgi:hypothetical protein
MLLIAGVVPDIALCISFLFSGNSGMDWGVERVGVGGGSAGKGTWAVGYSIREIHCLDLHTLGFFICLFTVFLP